MVIAPFDHRFIRYLTAIGILFQVNTVLAIGFNGTCKPRTGIRVAAFTHWPFGVNCDHLKGDLETHGNEDSIECFVYYNGSKYEEGLFELNELTDINIYEAKLIINNTDCISSNVTVDLRPFPSETCLVSASDNLHQRSNTIDNHVRFDCKPIDGSPDIIPKGANRKQFETKWLTKCDSETKYRRNNGWMNVEPPVSTYPDSLDMSRVDFYDATNFTCSVKYKSRTLYIVTYAQCIKQKVDQNAPSITCTQSEMVAKGETATFDCTGQMAIGETNSDDLKIQWKKDDKVICENHFFDRDTAGNNKRLSCIARDETHNASLHCVPDTDSITDDDIQPSRKKIEMTFNISDVESGDFGAVYSIEFHVQTDGLWQSTKQEMALNEDTTPTIRMIITILASLLAALLVILFVTLVLYKKRIYILLWYKRMRMKYDKDDKHYVGYLSYLYNGDCDSKSDQATKKIVFAIQTVMEDLEYKYYDEQREGNFEPVVEKITNLVENSHRMIIVLTKEYLNDKWRRFHAELGFHGLLESRMGLIFILTPGVKKALVKRAKTDKVWEKLLIALKGTGQSIINWKEKMSDDELKSHIEYALPMLARKKRALSILSDSDGEIDFKNGVAYHRSMSEMTSCTVVSPDANHAVV